MLVKGVGQEMESNFSRPTITQILLLSDEGRTCIHCARKDIDQIALKFIWSGSFIVLKSILNV